MEAVRLGRDGVELRPLGLGTNSWSPRGIDGAREALAASLAAGIRLVDTAEVYGRGASELTIGALLRESGGDPLVATKFAPLPQRLSARALGRALGASLERLGRTDVALYQIHWPFTLLSIESLMERMVDEVEAGRIEAVGVSNYGAAQMRRAHAALARRGVPLRSNQVNYSLLQRAPERNGVLAGCRELGVTLIAYTPLASGALTGKYHPGGEVPRDYRRFLRAFRRLERALPVLDELRKLAADHGRTPAQVALHWLARQPGVIPIPGAKNGRQAAENAGALDFSLAPAELARLDAVSRAL